MATWNRNGVAQSSTNTYGQITVASNNDTIIRLETNTDSESDDAVIELVTDADGTPREARIGVDHSDNTLKILHGATFSGGTNGICVGSTGKVGIGTATPEHMLHLESAGDVGLLIRADSDNSGEQDNPLIALQQDYSAAGATGTLVNMDIGMVGLAGEIYTSSLANASYVQAQGSTTSNNDTGIMQFVTGGNNGQDTDSSAAAGTARLTILADGKIGIGSTSPDTKLHIREDVDGYFDALRLENADNASSATRGVDLTFRPYRGYTGGRIRCQRRANWSSTSDRDSSLDFYTVSNETESLAMRIDYNGYVGIGTTTPTEALHLSSTSEEHPNIVIEKSGSANHDGGNFHFRLTEDSGFINNGKEIGDLQWYSYDSTEEDYNASAMIRVTASGTQAHNRSGGEMSFWTNSDTTETSKKMTIDSAGVVSLTSYMVEGRTVIKIPATSFIANDDQLSGYQFAILEDDGSNFGTRVGGAGAELFAYVDVPLGYTATKVKITGSDTANAVEVYTLDLDDGTIGSEISNSGLTVADDTALASNHVGADDKMLLIKVVTTATDDIVYGGYVTIQAT